jgi:glycerol-3-phosphate acyltransferase PlsY
MAPRAVVSGSDSYTIFIYLGLPLFAYLLGSIPWGLVFTRLFTQVDIRRQGSGNIGATNVSRVAGSTLGMFTFAGDILKGALPVFIAVSLVSAGDPWPDAWQSAVALAAFLGHLYPVFTGFKDGGKGVATAAGCFLVLSPFACLTALGAFILLIGVTRYVSAGSLGAALVLPPAVWFWSHTLALTVAAAVMAALIFRRHSPNIKRLVRGTEPRFRDSVR